MPDSQNPQLVAQFLALSKALSSDASNFDVLISWLESHQDYDASVFWQQRSEKGAPMLQAVLETVSIKNFRHLFMHLQKEYPQHMDQLCNTPNAKGAVLLHGVWAKCQSSTYSFEFKEYDDCLSDLMTLTSSRFWTWKDGVDAIAGSGWAGELVAAMNSHGAHTSTLSNLLNRLSQVYPQTGKQHSKSPWLSVSSESQVQALLDLGMTLADELDFKTVKLPAWRYLYHSGMRPEYLEGLMQAADLGASWQQIQELDASFAPLVVHDHRAKIGYVRSVLANKGTDSLGRNSVDYLLHYRGDLWETFCDNLSAWSSSKHVEKILAQRDVFGYSLAFRSLLQSPTHFRRIKWLADRHQADLQYGVEGGGWWDNELKNTRQWSIVSSYAQRYSGRGSVSVPVLDAIMDLSPNADFYWGDPERQKKWITWWDKVLPQAHGMVTVLDNNSSSSSATLNTARHKYLVATRQALMFAFSPHLQDQLDPALCAQLTMAAHLVLPSLPSRDTTHKYRRLSIDVLRNKELALPVDAPSMFTPQMIYLLGLDTFSMKFRSQFRHMGEEESQQAFKLWRSAAQKFMLLDQVGPQSTSIKQTNRRKM